MRAIKLQHESKDPVTYPGSHCVNRLDVPGGATYVLVSSQHYPIMVVTNFGSLLGFNSFSALWRNLGMGFKNIQFMGLAKIRTFWVQFDNGDECIVKGPSLLTALIISGRGKGLEVRDSDDWTEYPGEVDHFIERRGTYSEYDGPHDGEAWSGGIAENH